MPHRTLAVEPFCTPKQCSLLQRATGPPMPERPLRPATGSKPMCVKSGPPVYAKSPQPKSSSLPIRRLEHADSPDSVHQDARDAEAAEAKPYAVGQRVFRKGEACTVVKVDQLVDPPSYVVRKADGSEVGSEHHLLQAVMDECWAVPTDDTLGSPPIGACQQVAKIPASWGPFPPQLRWDGLMLTQHDICSLNEGCMLNDSMIDFFLRLLQHCAACNKNTYIFPCHFFTRLKASGALDGDAGWANVKGLTKRIALFDNTDLVVPINCDSHWWLTVVQLRDSDGKAQKVPPLFCIDSLLGPGDRHWDVQHYLRGYLQREHILQQIQNWDSASEFSLAFDFCHMAATVQDGVPQQTNGVDCGVFLIENVRRLISGIAHPSHSNDWCNQSQALRCREALRKIIGMLHKEASSTSIWNVPELLESSPDLFTQLHEVLTVRCVKEAPPPGLPPAGEGEAGQSATSPRRNETKPEEAEHDPQPRAGQSATPPRRHETDLEAAKRDRRALVPPAAGDQPPDSDPDQAPPPARADSTPASTSVPKALKRKAGLHHRPAAANTRPHISWSPHLVSPKSMRENAQWRKRVRAAAEQRDHARNMVAEKAEAAQAARKAAEEAGERAKAGHAEKVRAAEAVRKVAVEAEEKRLRLRQLKLEELAAATLREMMKQKHPLQLTTDPMKAMGVGSAKAITKGVVLKSLKSIATEHDMKTKDCSNILNSLVTVAANKVKKTGVLTTPGLSHIKPRTKPATKACTKMISVGRPR